MEMCCELNNLREMVVQSISQESTKVLSEIETCKNILDFLDIYDGIICLKYPDFVLTNSHFLQICKDKNKHNITLENLSLFFTTYCKYNISRVMFIRILKKLKGYIVKLNRAKNLDFKKHFLSSALSFKGAFSDVVGLLPSDACSTPTSIYNSEIVPNQVTVFVFSDLNLQITNDELS
ncbi:uncharacterized protein LOC136092619 [Hydra vulgaris]|uniref:uncharacterized protein LOC136092619 n=1 Tax=Hydra vulgaris TaxID=6087 RepID=UPI0032EA34E5